MGLRILKPGVLSTIQDLGRWGYQAAGVPVSGAMDRYSMQLANMLCGNPPGLPVIETAWHGAQFLAESDLLLSCCGGGASLHVNGVAVPHDRPVFIPAYSLLTLDPTRRGFYTYLAVAGGFRAGQVMGSASTYTPSKLGGIGGNALQAGLMLDAGMDKTGLSLRIEASLQQEPGLVSYPAWGIGQDAVSIDNTVIRATEGPEYHWFDPAAADAFWQSFFTLSVRSNRMGSRLEGHRIQATAAGELLSTAVTRGTVQVTLDGTPVVLMADAQTTGGYPRIAQVAAVDIPQLVQLRPGEGFRFSRISGEQAEELYLEQETKLRQVQRNIALRFGM
jgi:antagonist of KipI